MVGKKDSSKYRRKRKGFPGTQKQHMDSEAAASSSPLSSSISSPGKLNRSLDKIKRNCPLLKEEQTKVVTRKQAFNLGLVDNNNDGRNPMLKAHSNKIIDATLLQDCISKAAICSHCRSPDSLLELWQNDNKRHGLNEALFLKCNLCNHEVPLNTSKRNATRNFADANIRIVHAGLVTGNGLSSLQKICTAMNFPQPPTSCSYNNILKLEHDESLKEANESLQTAGQNLKQFMIDNHSDCNNSTLDETFSVSVSVDGTWQKRYGYNSLLGVVFILSVDTGEVLDYEVKSKYCFECKARAQWDKSSERYRTWYEQHKNSCSINHEKSAESMEKNAAVEMFQRSKGLHNLKYTTYVGDGDSSSFGEVAAAMQEEYGDEYIVVKEDCIGHIQKRMGSNLRRYKNKNKGKLSDGGTIGGRGRLTDAVIDNFQNYYGAAIRNNAKSIENMVNAIWAIFHHSILSENNEPLFQQHRFCPQGAVSWCQYQKDQANNTNTYNTNKCLPPVFRSQLKPIFTRLSDKTLLERCLKGLTQNANEAINSILWSKCPKRVFCSKTKLQSCAALTILEWNSGAAGSSKILTNIGVQSGVNTNIGDRLRNRYRIHQAAHKCKSKYRKRRQVLRQTRKQKKVDTASYQSGAFGTSKYPNKNKNANYDINNSGTPGEKKNGVEKVIKLVFVDDSEVLMIRNEMI